MPDAPLVSSLSLTFDDLILEVAEMLGIAVYSGNVAAVPADPGYDSDLCKRIVNRAYRDFLSRKPRWTFQDQLLTLTFDPTGASGGSHANVDTDAGRYSLGPGFNGRILRDWRYPGNGPRISIAFTDEGSMASLLAQDDSTGDPYHWSMRRLDYQGSPPAATGGYWEVLFWPRPAAVYTINTMVRVMPAALSDGADRPISGPEHDNTLICAARAWANKHLHGTDVTRDSDYSAALASSIAIDNENEPKTVGFLDDMPMSQDDWARWQVANGVSSYNGTPIT